MINSVGPTVSRLTDIYNTTGDELASVMEKIALGKKYLQPSDDYVSYNQAATLQNGVTQNTQTNADIALGKVYTDAGTQAGNQLYTDAVNLQNLAANYAAAAPADQAAIGAQFTTLATQILGEVSTANVGGIALFGGAIPTVNLGGGQTLDFTANGVIGTGATIGTDAGTATTVTAGAPDPLALAAAATLVTDAQAYVTGMQTSGKILDNQTAINNTIIASQNAAIDSISKIDDAAALTQETDLQLRQEAAVSMMAQANISQYYLGRLYGGGSSS